VLHGAGLHGGTAEVVGGFIAQCADGNVQQRTIFIGPTKPRHHLIGSSGNRFGRIMHAFGRDQTVGSAPTNAVRYGCVRCHYIMNDVINNIQYILS
jgi:hypothetical protein